MLLSGEPGIGKSRLTAALLERLAAEPHTRLRYFCSPQRTDSAFFPIISQMERAAGFAQDDTVRAKLDKLDALMAQSHTPRQDIALFADMLSLPNDGRYPTLDLTPQQRRQKTLEALRGPVETFARKRPVLMILEDAHWADPTSLEVFSGAVDRTRARRALLIITFRPEFEPPWIGQPHVSVLTLNRLTRRGVDTMIDRIIGNRPLPANVRQDIIERTDGIPLFVEEMTKAVLETESESAAQRTAAAIPFPAQAVPATLHASLMARLDRLGAPARRSRRSGQQSAASSPIRYWQRWRESRKPSWRRHLTEQSRPICFSGRASRPMQRICSSMCSYRTRLMARFCVSRAARCMPASPKLSKVSFLRSPRTSPRFWRITVLRLA